METYDTLTYTDTNMITDAVELADDIENDFEEVLQEDEKFKENIVLKFKRKAIEFCRSRKNNRRGLEVVQHHFKKVTKHKLLWRWEAQFVKDDSDLQIIMYLKNMYHLIRILPDFKYNEWMLFLRMGRKKLISSNRFLIAKNCLFLMSWI